MLPPCTRTTCPTVSIPHETGTFVTTDEPTLTHQHHPKSTNYITVHFTLGAVCSMGLDRCIMSYIPHQNVQSISTALKIPCTLPIHLSTPYPWQPVIFFIVSADLSYPEFHVVGIIQYVVFSDQLLSLSSMHLNFPLVFSQHDSSFLPFLVLNNILRPGSTIVQLDIHLLLGCFQVGAIRNGAAVKISVGGYANVSFHLLRVNTKEHSCWVVCKCTFSLVRNHQTVFQSGCTASVPTGMCESSCGSASSPAFGVSFLDSGQSTRCEVVFNLHISDDIRWGAHFHVSLPSVLSLVRFPYRSLAHFLISACSFSCWVLRALCAFQITVLDQMHFLQIFSPSLFLTLLSFAEQKVLILMEYQVCALIGNRTGDLCFTGRRSVH